MEKQLRFNYDGSPQYFKYKKSIVDGKTIFTVSCGESVSQHIPDGFRFISQGKGFNYFPIVSDKTEEIAAKILDAIMRHEMHSN